jgi:hypothetical protein
MTSEHVPEGWLTEDELCKQTGITRRQLRRWVKQGLLPMPRSFCNSRGGAEAGAACLDPLNCRPNRCRHPNAPVDARPPYQPTSRRLGDAPPDAQCFIPGCRTPAAHHVEICTDYDERNEGFMCEDHAYQMVTGKEKRK